MKIISPVLLCCLWIVVSCQQEGEDAAENDAVRGTVKTYLNRPIRVFTGIPYALPPKGRYRFAKPQPLKPTGNLRSATEIPPSCLQYTLDIPPFQWLPEPNTTFSEDCLYLNLWTPYLNVKPDEPRPTSKAVMVFIHGGGFRTGSGSLETYEGGILAAYGDIVVVTINYRLGAFGFLQLNSKISGNMGLYDQVRALEWVHNNIEFFGGNPNKVTVVGHEAGAVAVGMLLMSPLCKGLFQQAALLSGAPNWLVDPMDSSDSINKAKTLAKKVGCAPERGSILKNPGRLIQQMGQCLMKQDASNIILSEAQILNGSYYSFMPRQRDLVVPMDPVMAVANGHVLPVDVLIGYTQNEGFMQAYKLFPQIFNLENPMNITLDEAKEILEESVWLFPGGAKDYIIDMYFGNVSDSDEPWAIRHALSQAFGDIFVNCPARIFAESYGDRPMNSFMYHFTHRPLFSPYPEYVGATSFDDVPYIFGDPLRHPERYSLDDTSITKLMMNLMSTFVKTGTPEPVLDYKVPKLESPDLKYVELSNAGVIERKYPSPQCDFWKKFYPKNT